MTSEITMVLPKYRCGGFLLTDEYIFFQKIVNSINPNQLKDQFHILLYKRGYIFMEFCKNNSIASDAKY